MTEHEKRCATVAKKYGYTKKEVSDAVQFYFRQVKEMIHNKVDECVRLPHIGVLWRFNEREEERANYKKRRMARSKERRDDKAEHKKHIYLQRRVQAL